MQDWAVASILLAVSIVITALLIVICRQLGGRPWILAWLTGDKEEKAQLAKNDGNFINGYVVNSECTVSIDGHDHYSNEVSSPPTTQPVAPPPLTKQWSSESEKRRASMDTERRRSSLDWDLPDILSFDGFPTPRIQRAMSCDSVSSDTSVVLETLDSPEHTGELDVQLQYNESEELIVHVKQARDLVTPDPNIPINSYVRVCLMPEESSSMQTRVQINTSAPIYNEKFLFGLKKSEVASHWVIFYVYICDKHSNTMIGEAEIRLSEVDLRLPHSAKLAIIDSSQKLNSLGDLMFSLSYLPTAERLTVVIVKARNLQLTESSQCIETFVKVYLLQNGKKVRKKKTSMKKDDRNPVFNEAMIFSVPANELQNIQLRLTVVEYFSHGKTFSLGHIFVGSQCTGKSLTHWNQMMSSLRKPIALWHTLKK